MRRIFFLLEDEDDGVPPPPPLPSAAAAAAVAASDDDADNADNDEDDNADNDEDEDDDDDDDDAIVAYNLTPSARLNVTLSRLSSPLGFSTTVENKALVGNRRPIDLSFSMLYVCCRGR